MFLLMGVLAWVAVQGQEGSMAELLRKQYEEASLQYAKEPDNVAVLMEMARLVSNTECAQYSLTQAADYLGKAEEIYTARALDKGRYNEMQKLTWEQFIDGINKEENAELIEYLAERNLYNGKER